MVRLEVLSGSKAGTGLACSRFPVRIGRAPENDLSLNDSGVWPFHFSIQRRGNDLVIEAGADALVRVNGEAIHQAALRNGDVIGLGAASLQFGFQPVRQASLRWREALTWAALGALALGEVAIAYALW